MEGGIIGQVPGMRLLACVNGKIDPKAQLQLTTESTLRQSLRYQCFGLRQQSGSVCDFMLSWTMSKFRSFPYGVQDFQSGGCLLIQKINFKVIVFFLSPVKDGTSYV